MDIAPDALGAQGRRCPILEGDGVRPADAEGGAWKGLARPGNRASRPRTGVCLAARDRARNRHPVAENTSGDPRPWAAAPRGQLALAVAPAFQLQAVEGAAGTCKAAETGAAGLEQHLCEQECCRDGDEA